MKTTQQNYLFTCFIRCYEMARQYFGHDFSLSKEGEMELLKKSLKPGNLAYEEYCISKLMKYFEVDVLSESIFIKQQYYENSKNLENRIKPVYKILSLNDYISAVKEGAAIVSLDAWHLDMIFHRGHWIFVSDYKNGEFTIHDPAQGEEFKMGEYELKEAVKSLKETIGDAPILVKIREKG